MKLVLALSILLFQTPQPVFRADVNFVELDVSVLGPDRRPLTGLTAADFTVLEDGVPQTIQTFQAVTLPDPVPPPAVWWNAVPGDVERNVDREDGILLTLVVDDEGIGSASAVRARTIAHAIVERMSTEDRMAVVFTLMGGRSQDFTRDRSLLHAAIDRFTPGLSTPTLLGANDGDTGRGNDRPSRLAAPRRSACAGVVDVLRQLARLAAAYPGRRKAAIVVSERLPALEPVSDCLQPLLELYRDARAANLNVYPVNPRGLTGIGDAELRTREDAAAAMAATARTGAAERTLAEITGGIALSQTNAFAAGLDRLFAENRSYYLIGYVSTNTSTKPALRRLAVTVARDGATVRARTGYAPGAGAPAKETHGMTAELAAASAALVPAAGLPLEATVIPFRRDGGTALVVVAAARPQLQAGPDVVSEEIQVRATVVNARGEVKGGAERRIQARGAAVEGAVSEIRVPMDVAVEPGRYQVRVAANSRASGATGSVFVNVTVPDFDREPLSMSGVALTVPGDSPALTLAALDSLLPFVPSTRRVFRSSETLKAAVRVYAQAQPGVGTLVCRVRDAQAAEVWSGRVSVELAVPRVREGILATCPVPLGRLARGHYLLELEMRAASHAAVRQVKFSID